ncbi:MAG: response regulator [Chitinophagales bacterium]|nr:response regulator [Chitinophagales bacterium]
MGHLILAIDDDAMVHKLLEFSLKDEGFQVEPLLGAKEAQAFLSNNGKDVVTIILDWEMPGMSGLDFLQWLKAQEQYKSIPVIMLTGRSRKEEIKAGIDAGAYYYVTKPFNKEFLKSILKAAIADYLQIKVLREQIEHTKNPFSLLVDGLFKFRTMEEAQRLSVLIANASPSPEETLIICELFNNAIEHGNLGITYQEKSKFIEEGKLQEEIKRRLHAPEHASKYAEVRYMHGPDALVVSIEDQGIGFDYEKYLTFDEARVFDTHGRGIAMANTILDIHYVGKGNKVVVTIPYPQNGAAQ